MTTADVRTTGFNQLQALTMRLVTEVESLAALVARLELDAAGEPGDPEVTAQLDRVVDLIGAADLCVASALGDLRTTRSGELTAGRR